MSIHDPVREGAVLSFGPFRAMAAERLLLRNGVNVDIGGRSLDILTALASRAGKIVSKDELISAVWPSGERISDVTLRVHINALRKALGDGEDGSRYVVNVPKRGYSFVASVEESASTTLPTAFEANPDLPALPSTLVGREDTINTLSTLVENHRLVNVVGPGGLGKTTTALVVAHAVSDRKRCQVCFVDLSVMQSPSDIVGAVILAVGCTVTGIDLLDSLTSFLTDRKVLIVFDSCEHVIEAAADLVSVLSSRLPGISILATSREPLRVEGEFIHLLAPLEAPSEGTTTAVEALESPAVQLFMSKALAGGYVAVLSDQDAVLVSTLCRRLDGNPLAIELVASRVSLYGIRETAELLEEGAVLAIQGRRNAAPRHQTLRAMVEWSYNLLSDDEKKVFRRLSIFVGRFSVQAALHVVSNGFDDPHAASSAVLGLVEKSLVATTRDAGAGHFRLLDTTRAFARQLSEADDGSSDLASRHARYFLSSLKTEFDASFDSGKRRRDSIGDIGNIRKALEWFFACGESCRDESVRLAAYSSLLFLELSLYMECNKWSQQGLAALGEEARGTKIELALQEGLAISTVATWGVTEELYQAIERGLQISVDLQDLRHQAKFLAGLHVYRLCRFDSIGAVAAAGMLAEIAEGCFDITTKTISEWTLGNAHQLDGDQEEAFKHFIRGFELETDEVRGMMDLFEVEHRTRALSSFVRCLWTRGHADQAAAIAIKTLHESAVQSSTVTFCHSVLYMLQVCVWCGREEEVEAFLELAFSKTQSQTMIFYQALALSVKGELLLRKGEVRHAVEALKEADRIIQAYRCYMLEPAASAALADALDREGRSQEALAIIEEAVSHLGVGRGYYWLPELLRVKASIVGGSRSGDFVQAERLLDESIGVARKQFALAWELKSSISLARLWHETYRTEEAFDMLEAIYRKFTEGFETPDLQEARSLLDVLRDATTDHAQAQAQPVVSVLTRRKPKNAG